MTDSNKNVPKLRFPGFTDDWEQRKLNDMADFSKGNGYSKADLIEDGNPVILYGRLYTNYEMIIESVDTFAKLKDKSVISKGSEVIIPASGESAEDIARASVVESAGIVLGGDLNIIRTNNELDPTFLALTISNGSQKRKMSKRAQGKSVVHLHNSDLKEINLLVPKLEEQKEIRSFFKQLNYAITLHQRKLSNIQKLKSGLLQKMFPKNGENVPEIRFPEFTNAWEQRKLKYVASYRNGKAHEQVEDENGKFTIVNSKFISTDGKVKRNTNEQVEPMFKGELAIVLSDLPNGKALAKVFLVNENEKYTLNQRIAGITPKENCDSKFLSYRMNRHSYFLKFDSGVSQTNLSKPQVEEFVTLYPSFEEQQKIGSFFKQLDDTIALHQRKLKHLQQQKKALLQQMFI